MLDRQQGELIELLYQAVGEPNLWPEFLAGLSKKLEAPGVALLFHSASQKKYEINLSVGLPEPSLPLYAEYFGAKDVWALGVRNMKAGTVELGTDICPSAKFEESEFYIDFLTQHRPFFYQCGVILENNLTSFGAISCLREVGQENFTQDHLQLLSQISVHLRHALKLHRQILDGQQALKTTMDAVSRFDAGLIRAEADGKVYFANSVAEQMLRGGHSLKSDDGRLTCSDPRQKSRLLNLLKAACNPHLGTLAGGSMVLGSDDELLYATVFPHPANQNLFASSSLATVVITDSNAVLKSREQSLKTLFGLTPAEASVAMLIAEGKNPKEIAEIHEVKWNTIRAQLRQIYAKTGANNQLKLMKLVSQLPGEA